MTYTFEERDEYKRKNIAININKLISSAIDISPIVIDGDWGTGKTELCLKLQNFFTSDDLKYKVIYIDAFKEDYSDDPLLTITAAIAAVLPPKEKNALISKAIPAMKFGIKTVLKAGSGWLLRQNFDQVSEEFKEAFKQTSDAAIDSTIESLINEHIELEGNLKALKDKIKQIATKSKIVIIIDELDRCRPSFSVNVLEKIKHIFNIENVYFILATNKSQLQASVNHIYGSAINSKQYLDKFIKYTVSLPTSHSDSLNKLTQNSLKHWEFLCNNNEILNEVNVAYNKHIIDILKIKPLTLRETETFARHLQVYQILAGESAIKNKTHLSLVVTRLLAIYLNCFSENIRNIDHLDKEMVMIVTKSINFESFDIDLSRSSDHPLYFMALYGIMKEKNIDYSAFIKKGPDQQKTIKFLEDKYERMAFSDFSTFSFSVTLVKAYNILSFQRN